MRLFTIALTAAVLLSLATEPAHSHEKGTVILRAGVATVDPEINSYSLSEDTPSGRASTFVDIRSATSMTITGTYMISQRWAVDILAALPFKHDIDAYVQVPDPILGPIVYQGKIADTEQLPPTISLQYHFSPRTALQPYVGVGVNWTTFSSTRSTDLLDDIVGEPISKLNLDDSSGLAVQAGGDWKIGDRAIVNFDVRWIDIDTDVSVESPSFQGEQKLFTAKVDPWVWSLSIGFHF